MVFRTGEKQAKPIPDAASFVVVLGAQMVISAG